MNINSAKNIYMIGVKGVGMTMLAQFLAAKGKKITGSDTNEKFMTDSVLKKAGIKVIEGFSPDNIIKDYDLIVYSTAYNEKTNVEVKKVFSMNFPKLSYAEAMAQIFNQEFGIAVIGSHGKTTTTAWLGFVLEQAGLSPSVMVGARVPQFDGSSIVGNSSYLVIEADEYQNKLKNFEPQAVLLNNIDYDHPDFFATRSDYIQVFIDFIKKIPKKGWLIANFDDKIIQKIARVNCRGKVITYGLKESADYVAYNVREQNNKQYFSVKLGVDEFDAEPLASDSNLGEFSTPLYGEHNVYNALAVIAASIELNIPLSEIRRYLDGFSGTARRMEELGKFRTAVIVDDYAHHPTEIKSTIRAVKKKFQGKNITVVFHPHTFTRTKALLEDFSKSFKEADKLIVLDIYGSAREEHGGVHSQDLVKLIEDYNKSNKTTQAVLYLPTLRACEEYLRKNISKDELILLMGAGDVFRIGENLLK